jgi:Domain of unknown function (DUF4331)
MSHHFDPRLARENPSLNLCDFYLFAGAPGTTVMAMTVNPDASLTGTGALHPEGLYAFRFDLNGDAREEVTFKMRFGEVEHAGGDEHLHVQRFSVRRADGPAALGGTDGELLVEGETGTIVSRSGVRAFAGSAPDLFAADATALHMFANALHHEQRYFPDAFRNRQNFFARHNVTALVLEVPTELIGSGSVGAWATISLSGHAPELQVSRWGIPILTHLYLNAPENQELKEQFNVAVPAEDRARFAPAIARFVERLTTYAGSSADPAAYGAALAARLCPAILPYQLGTPATFVPARFNGRPLTDDAMDVMLTLAANQPLADGVQPDARRTRREFPYFGAPYVAADAV